MLDLPISPLYLLGSISIGIIVPSVCGFLAMFYKCPERLVLLGLRYQMYKCGMKVKYVKREEATFCYGEKNHPKPDQPTLVFVHGFTASKIQWLAAFNGLRMDCHMIALDMPGHGDSSVPAENEPINLDFMDSRLCSFLEGVGLADKKVHLIGVSLGGALVGIFSALHPDKVAKVTMVCPAMNPPVESDFIKSLKKTMKKSVADITHDDCILLPQDINGLTEMFENCIYNKELTKIHPVIFQGILNLRLRKNDYFLRLYKATNTQEYLDMLACLAPSITMPSQIMWGKQDEIIDSSGAEYLKARLADCRFMDKFDNCGHAVDIDRPGSFCKALEKFIRDN